MSDPQGKFCWYELMTTDLAAAGRFYGSVIGWGVQESGMPGMAYTLFTVGDTPISGMAALPEDAVRAGARPGWIGYVWVGDVDAAAARVAAAGGALHRPAADIPGIGRSALVADPQGASFVLFRNAGAERPPLPAPSTPGLIGWHELHAGDREAAFAFYAALFGWTKTEAVDMGGALGLYQIFASGEAAVGGMMTRMDASAPPAWLYYFKVDDIDGAASRVTAGSGTVLNGPQEVPGGTWVVQARDPQGAMFALIGPHR